MATSNNASFVVLKLWLLFLKSKNQSQNVGLIRSLRIGFVQIFWDSHTLFCEIFALYPDINNEQIGDIQMGIFCNHISVKGCKNKII